MSKRKKKPEPEGCTAVRHVQHHTTPKELSSAFDKFIATIEKGDAEDSPHQLDEGHGGWYPPYAGAKYLPISFEVYEALAQLHRDLKRAFKDYGKKQNKIGVESGKNLLLQLNSGDITMSDFNDTVVAREDD